MTSSKPVTTKCDEKKITPNHIPAKGWKGGIIKNHPELQYKDGIADLSSLDLTCNLDNICKIKRQQR